VTEYGNRRFACYIYRQVLGVLPYNEIAAKLNIPRIKISFACETLQVKIKPCQLGAF
jgi:hypothetical protein